MNDVISEESFIGCQPIIDRHQQLFAYELLFRSSAIRNSAEVVDDLSASGPTILARRTADVPIVPDFRALARCLSLLKPVPSVLR